MVTTLRNAKAKLSALVARAQHGEDIVISVRGRLAARLVAVRTGRESDRQGWLSELAALRARWTAQPGAASTDGILAELREDRC